MLEPREAPKVGIYACGPTVYGRVHVGNARPFVVFALLRRFLEREGYEPTLVANVTDVNDKIYDAAREAGVPSEQLAAEMTAAYVRDTDALGLGRPDHEPLASEAIEGIVGLISDLAERGHAYPAGGDVYFRVPSFPAYGKLSNRPLDEMQQGEGDDEAALKENAQDFALWKARKEGEDTAWPSPWGEGRPGWHIECSAMAESLLGTDFEIHGGGSDLVFPHHENEIAQTEAARGRPLARIWMHNGMVRFEGEKMAKSVGNIALLHEALERYGAQTLIMYFAGGHYHQPLAFSPDELDDARGAVKQIRGWWGHMLANGPGTGWFVSKYDGTVDRGAFANTAWTTALPALSKGLLGVEPTAPGYRKWLVAPQPSGLAWAQGRVPVPGGSIAVRWRRADWGFVLTVDAPRGSHRGQVAVPLFGGRARHRDIAMDGRLVWHEGQPANGARARVVDGAVVFSGLQGSHTFAWSSRRS